MEVTLPSDCGNAPRIAIVEEIIQAWAAHDSDALTRWLADTVEWQVIGGETHRGPGAASDVSPAFTPERLEVFSVVTHGRLASCDGVLEAGDRRVAFSHAFRFSSAAKTGKVAEVRTYCIKTSR